MVYLEVAKEKGVVVDAFGIDVSQNDADDR